MKVFGMTVGKSRSEFWVEVENGKYIGKINDEIVCESSDYESVRTNIMARADKVKNEKTQKSCGCLH
jgi:hypothetical protein